MVAGGYGLVSDSWNSNGSVYGLRRPDSFGVLAGFCQLLDAASEKSAAVDIYFSPVNNTCFCLGCLLIPFSLFVVASMGARDLGRASLLWLPSAFNSVVSRCASG